MAKKVNIRNTNKQRTGGSKSGKALIARKGRLQKATAIETSQRPQSDNEIPTLLLKIKRKYILIPLVIVILGALLYLGRGLFVAAIVNGQPISRLAVVQELEKRAGKQILTSMITRSLIEQEARKKNVQVSDAEINEEIKKIEAQLKSQDQKLEDVLSFQGMSKKDLVEQIRMQKTAEKIFAKDLKVTDEEVNKYIEENKASFEKGPTDEAKKTARESIKQRKLSETFQSWLQTAQSKASILQFVQY